MLHTIAADAGQWIFATDYHLKNGITVVEAIAGRAVPPLGSQFDSRLNEAAHCLGEIAVDLVGPVVEDFALILPGTVLI